jgi:uncharacterized protein
MLHVDLRSLDPGYHALSLEPAPEDVGLSGDEFRDVLVEVGMDFEGKQILLNLTASAVAALVCDRTLVDFEQSIRGQYTVLFSSVASENESVDEIRSFEASDERIDITDIVRDTLLLAIPVRKIAPGAEDVDIPLAFGAPADADVDPRWEALKSLRESEGEEETSGQ